MFDISDFLQKKLGKNSFFIIIIFILLIIIGILMTFPKGCPITHLNKVLRVSTNSGFLPDLAKYKNLFGEPGTNVGMRKYRIFGIAVFDTLIVLFCAFLLSIIDGYPFWINAIGLFLLGIIVHRLFCVRTAVDKILFT